MGHTGRILCLTATVVIAQPRNSGRTQLYGAREGKHEQARYDQSAHHSEQWGEQKYPPGCAVSNLLTWRGATPARAIACRANLQVAVAWRSPSRTDWTARVTPDHIPAILVSLRSPSFARTPSLPFLQCFDIGSASQRLTL